MRFQRPSAYATGVAAAILTPLMLGVAPIFGKQAIAQGADPFSVAAIRTVIAAVLLWVVYALFMRKSIFIYPAGLLGCVVVGVVNGIGSLFYYSGLGLLDASLVQLLNGTYMVFAVLLSRIGGEKINRRIGIRIALACAALIILTGFGNQPVNWLGVGFMLANALMFAGTVILSQYVLYEMPPTTATLYILTTMAVVVVMAWAAVGKSVNSTVLEAALPPIFILGITTALSRLAMFASVSVFGSLRTAIIAVAEIGVALTLAFFVLGDRLTTIQVIGVGLLIVSMLLIRSTDLLPRGFNPNALLVHDMANVQFQRIAFHRAFGKAEHDNEYGVMSTLTTSELIAIQKMLGASNKPVDPFPIKGGYTVDLSAFLPQQDDTHPTNPLKNGRNGSGNDNGNHGNGNGGRPQQKDSSSSDVSA
ncbi:MAG TPA: DMT family transporter [Phototrophicaceae bacterium]|nr:DMT family transporter [Phototrophicaceae bacterium]